MNGWDLTVSTGNPEQDRAMVDHYGRAAAAQGMVLEARPLPQGGYHVRATPRAGAQPQAWGAQQAQQQAPQPQAWGAQQARQQAWGAQQAPQQQAWGAQQPQQQAPQQQAWGAPAMGQAAFAGAGAGAGWSGSGAMAGSTPGSLIAGGGAVEEGRERVLYLRKVYGLLAASAALAILFGFGMLNLGGTVPFMTDTGHKVAVPSLVAAMLDNPALLYGSFGLLFVSTLGASYVSRVKGLNIAALFFVSALMGVEIAPMVFVAQVFGGLGEALSLNPVRDTFLMVGAIFTGITSYVFVTRKDFSYLKAILNMGFWVVFAACLLTFVFDSEVFSLAVASVGALLAAGFLLFNTSRIFTSSDMDNPVGDALGLIVQLRNLFMFILRILMSSRR